MQRLGTFLIAGFTSLYGGLLLAADETYQLGE